jgi:hypothetical protein
MVKPSREQPITEATKTPGVMPLDYMISVIRDPKASQDRRDRMAIAAAPYCHARVIEAASRPPGKKEQQAEAADVAGVGTPWADDLALEIRAN